MIAKIKRKLKKLPLIDRYYYGKELYSRYSIEHRELSQDLFIRRNFSRIRSLSQKRGKVQQIAELIRSVDVSPAPNNSFFYSLDPFKQVKLKRQILDNCPVDYNWAVNSSFESNMQLLEPNSLFRSELQIVVDELRNYTERLKKLDDVSVPYNENIREIESLFSRPAEHFHEALQRILFVNQWVWQSAHKDMGFGHLDWILYPLYQKDLDSGVITEDDGRQYLRDFFLVLHDRCWYKSALLPGDTGQIIILGGIDSNNHYRNNTLTHLFIEIAKELKLPDPKVLLRVSRSMPDDLLYLAMECISTGIGAPILSNDDVVIPAMIQFGYDKEDAYDYGTSACWEPLTVGNGCEQNNVMPLNFCTPFLLLLDSEEVEQCDSLDTLKEKYFTYLAEYLVTSVGRLDKRQFEEDPLLTLFNPQVLRTGKDIARGGAKYANLGITSVGIASVVNSLLNLEKLVFEEKRFTLPELNNMRKLNFKDHEEVRALLDKGVWNFGEDEEKVISLTNEILRFASKEIEKHHTKLGGRYKYGLSSPNYIIDSEKTAATFDGRKAGQPFGVHISGKNGLPPTELISFASQLDYGGNRINGNVVDFILSPGFIKNNIDKAVALIKGGIRQGFFQLQMNVVDSKTLIDAQMHPELFPNLVVRVWGFSAYFKDLPKEYQDNLIRRTLEAEGAGASGAA